MLPTGGGGEWGEGTRKHPYPHFVPSSVLGNGRASVSTLGDAEGPLGEETSHLRILRLKHMDSRGRGRRKREKGERRKRDKDPWVDSYLPGEPTAQTQKSWSQANIRQREVKWGG